MDLGYSYRKDVEKTVTVTVNGRRVRMEDAAIYAATRADALQVDTATLIGGSLLYIIREGKLYMLDRDGGNWYSVADGKTLEEDG